jgi:hypothetical protein
MAALEACSGDDAPTTLRSSTAGAIYTKCHDLRANVGCYDETVMPNHLAHVSALLLGLAMSGASLFAGCSGSDPGPDVGDGGSSSTASSSGTSGTSSSGTSASNGGTTSSGASGTSGSSGASGTGGSSGGQTFDQCISACEAKYPKGVAIGKGIDQCWAKSCSTDCNGLGAGMQFPPAHGMCKNVVETPGAACSQCTVDHCCTAWDACFDNADCSALNQCSIACYK